MKDRPFDVVVPTLLASFVTIALVMAIAAPIAADPPVVALPFAVDDASAASLEWSVRRPPLVTVTPTGIVALAVAFATVTATAAATLIGPPLVEALGVFVPPEPVPPAAAAAVSAWLRSPATWPSTSPDGAEDEVPFADAVAPDDVVDGPIAVKVTAPPAVMSPKVVASAV